MNFPILIWHFSSFWEIISYTIFVVDCLKLIDERTWCSVKNLGHILIFLFFDFGKIINYFNFYFFICFFRLFHAFSFELSFLFIFLILLIVLQRGRNFHVFSVRFFGWIAIILSEIKVICYDFIPHKYSTLIFIVLCLVCLLQEIGVHQNFSVRLVPFLLITFMDLMPWSRSWTHMQLLVLGFWVLDYPLVFCRLFDWTLVFFVPPFCTFLRDFS